MSDVTLILPFDSGSSYVAPPGFHWANVLTPAELQAGWAPALPPEHIKQPLGEAIRLRIPPRSAEWATQAAAGFLRPGFELEALFFPAGIGVLVLRGHWVGNEKWKSFAAWQAQSDTTFGPVAQEASRQFAALAGRVGFQELPQVKRPEGPLEFPWTYPLFFDSAPSSGGGEPEVLARRTLDRVPLDIRWQGTDIYAPRPGSEPAAEIEWMFVIASITWECLFIIDELLSRKLGELNYQSPQGRQRHSDDAQELQQVRLFCKQAVDSSRALRWTIVRDRLDVLDGIQTAWSTTQMWQSIDDKTSLLVLIHEQHEAQAREETGNLLGYVALLIAIVSTVSAAADLLTFLAPGEPWPAPGWKRLGAVLLFPLVVGAVTVTLLVFRRLRRGFRT